MARLAKANFTCRWVVRRAKNWPAEFQFETELDLGGYFFHTLSEPNFTHKHTERDAASNNNNAIASAMQTR